MKTLAHKLMSTAAVLGIITSPAFAELSGTADATVTENGATVESKTTLETPSLDATIDTAESTADDAMQATKESVSDMAEATGEAASDAWNATKEGAQDVAAAIETFGEETVSEIVGTQVLTEVGEDIGEIDAIVVADGETKAIVGMGGFLGIGEHDVLIDIDQFSMVDENSVMIEGATQAQLEAMPDVDLADYTEVEGDMTIEQAMNS